MVVTDFARSGSSSVDRFDNETSGSIPVIFDSSRINSNKQKKKISMSAVTKFFYNLNTLLLYLNS